ncbi:MAG: SCP2 sterol-binding domain-containing protein [Chloroflexi bacterium]|nr:SCP2 sterol-binding domain-containing protein [Chloroflexota bacterium]
MTIVFPSVEWLQTLEQKLNLDAVHAEIAKNWEGDLFFSIEPAGNLKEPVMFYLDLWHGSCRKTEYKADPANYPNPAFTLTARYDDITAILSGKLNPMTAMMTMKLKVNGNMGYMMRNVPVILDFVRCAQEITAEIL